MKGITHFVVGATLEDLITDHRIEEKKFDEYDKYGKKTGMYFIEKKFIVDFPNKSNIILSKYEENELVFDFQQIGFKNGKYVGNLLNISLELFNPDDNYKNLDQKLIGISILNHENEKLIEKIDDQYTNQVIEKVKKQLAEVFGYVGSVNLFLTSK